MKNQLNLVKLIEPLAGLARLKMSKEEKNMFSREISSILEYIGRLNEAGAADSAAEENPATARREDKIENCQAETVKLILDNAPEKKNNLFKVRAVFE